VCVKKTHPWFSKNFEQIIQILCPFSKQKLNSNDISTGDFFLLGLYSVKKKVVKSNGKLWQINTISVFRGTFFNKCTANLILVSKILQKLLIQKRIQKFGLSIACEKFSV